MAKKAKPVMVEKATGKASKDDVMVVPKGKKGKK